MHYSAPLMVSIYIHWLLQTENKYQKEQKSERKHLQQQQMQADMNRYDSRKEQVQETQIHFDAPFFWSR